MCLREIIYHYDIIVSISSALFYILSRKTYNIV